MEFEDLIGKEYGYLTVIGIYNKKPLIWMCKCKCGKETNVRNYHLKSGHTKSCGCYQRERTSIASKTHGDSKTRMYRIYSNMKSRCQNPNVPCFDRYGSRGIRICKEWIESYENFKKWSLQNGYSDKKTIDRIDNNGDYCPENCRWVDDNVQRNNKRNNHYLTFNGETKTISEWAKVTGISQSVIGDRVRRYGWSTERALTTKVRSIKNNTDNASA